MPIDLSTLDLKAPLAHLKKTLVDAGNATSPKEASYIIKAEKARRAVARAEQAKEKATSALKNAEKAQKDIGRIRSAKKTRSEINSWKYACGGLVAAAGLRSWSQGALFQYLLDAKHLGPDAIADLDAKGSALLAEREAKRKAEKAKAAKLREVAKNSATPTQAKAPETAAPENPAAVSSPASAKAGDAPAPAPVGPVIFYGFTYPAGDEHIAYMPDFQGLGRLKLPSAEKAAQGLAEAARAHVAGLPSRPVPRSLDAARRDANLDLGSLFKGNVPKPTVFEVEI